MAIREVLGPSLATVLALREFQFPVTIRNAICEPGEADLTTIFHLTQIEP
jgi:hypothetical protein